MSITFTRKDPQQVFGGLRFAWGTFTDSSAGTADNLNTGLSKVIGVWFQMTASGVEDNYPTVNETMPCDGSAVTMICDASAAGYWYALGW